MTPRLGCHGAQYLPFDDLNWPITEWILCRNIARFAAGRFLAKSRHISLMTYQDR